MPVKKGYERVLKRDNKELFLKTWTQKDLDRLGFIKTEYFKISWEEAKEESSKFSDPTSNQLLEQEENPFDLTKD